MFPKLTAYIEPIDQSQWSVQPLPVRITNSTSLINMVFPQLSSCKSLPSQWPVNSNPIIDEETGRIGSSVKTLNQAMNSTLPTDVDPFLPWIHDVFPTEDGLYIQFIAQNRRRCESGRYRSEIKEHMQPNIALFQHVPIQQVGFDAYTGEERFKLSSHSKADEEGLETRFLCYFQSIQKTTLSQYNVNYDYHTYRKRYNATFTKDGFDNHIIWTSQLLFKCPVPDELVEMIRLGKSIENGYATEFIDLIPIRTPPRYEDPKLYMSPRNAPRNHVNTWLEQEYWGDNHILPRRIDSGRWANIPICQPSMITYPDDANYNDTMFSAKIRLKKSKSKVHKKHSLIGCTWTSLSFHTRNSRTIVSDGSRRLREWIEYHKLVGFDHIYLYDNSEAQLYSSTNSSNLRPIANLYPGFVTWINWSSKVCNNNSGNSDDKGERSSQYAALSSCRLRFGPHSHWLASIDTDEYLVPMGANVNLKQILSKVEKENIRILSFKSKRSKPRLPLLNTTAISYDCHDCFNPVIPNNTTFLHVYNCDVEKPPRVHVSPAEKQIYQPEYVQLHFVHYSTITMESSLSEEETIKAGISWRRLYKDRHTRFVDEEKEATMLHTKSIVTKETINWKKYCQKEKRKCMIGIPIPPGEENTTTFIIQINGSSWIGNCFPYKKIDNYWVPKLSKALRY